MKKIERISQVPSEQELAKLQATVRILGQEAQNAQVPADILADSIGGMQKLIYIVAVGREKSRVGKKLRFSQSFKTRYSLLCKMTRDGSYVVPMVLNSSNTSVQEQTSVMDGLESFLYSIEVGDLESIQEIFPDSNLMLRALIEAKNFLPKSESKWQFGFARNSGDEILLTSQSSIQVSEWLEAENDFVTLTGELVSIDFHNHKFVLLYPATDRRISCTYTQDLEEKLVANKRKLIQVTGEFTFDLSGNPIKSTDIARVEPIDLSSIVVEEILWAGQRLLLKEPLVFSPYLDEETKQLLVIEEPHICLYAFAHTRKKLLEEIWEQISFMWNEYVKSDESNLASDAIKLRKQLLQTFEESEIY